MGFWGRFSFFLSFFVFIFVNQLDAASFRCLSLLQNLHEELQNILGEPVHQGAAVVVRRVWDDRLLLQLRLRKSEENEGQTYGFPGGGREESDRDLVDTAVRETWEENHLLIDRDSLWLQYVGMHYLPQRGGYWFHPTFQSKTMFRRAERVEKNKHGEIKWVNRLELPPPAKIFRPNRSIIADGHDLFAASPEIPGVDLKVLDGKEANPQLRILIDRIKSNPR